MAFLPVIMILRDIEGGAGSGYAALLVLPVLWLALYSTGEAVAIAVAAVAAALVTPILIVGDPRYPSSEWRWTGITVTVVAVAGYTVLRLVVRSRRLAARLSELAATDSADAAAEPPQLGRAARARDRPRAPQPHAADGGVDRS